MFFTKTANVVAHLVFWFYGVLRLLTALLIAVGTEQEQKLAFARAYLAANSVGEAVDKAAIAIGIGVVLGVLSEISRNLNKP